MRQKARKWMLQGGKNQVEKEDIKIKLRLFETCLMTTLTYRMKPWKREDNGKALKRIFQLPVRASYAGVITETEVLKAE